MAPRGSTRSALPNASSARHRFAIGCRLWRSCRLLGLPNLGLCSNRSLGSEEGERGVALFQAADRGEAEYGGEVKGAAMLYGNPRLGVEEG